MSLLDDILNLIYPNVCGFCGRLEKSWLCDECFNKIEFRLNDKMRMPLTKEFDKSIYIVPYMEEFRDGILQYKFHGKSYMHKTFAKIILKSKKVCGILEKYDIITVAPVHKKRKKIRGYDQSELIAREVAKAIPNLRYERALKKIRNTEKQSLLNQKERANNVENAYIVIDNDIQGKKIVLFDDIYTTGSTVNECARLLKEYGAKEILVLTFAKKIK